MAHWAGAGEAGSGQIGVGPAAHSSNYISTLWNRTTAPIWSTAALCSAVGDVGEARALPEAGAALMWDFSIDDFCLPPTLGRYTFAAGTG